MNKIYLLGDLHAQAHHVENLHRRVGLDDTDTVILLGDVGANFWCDRRDETFKRMLSKIPGTFFCIRGNHERRASDVATMPEKRKLWTEEEYFGNKVLVEKKYPKIKYASDVPALYNIAGYTTLIIPGAFSPDKHYRKKGETWFENEQCSAEELAVADELFKNNEIDLVLSHTAPASYEPTDLFFAGFNQALIDKTMERELGHMEYIYDYKVWCWGHYHAFREYRREPVKPSPEDTRLVMLFNEEAVELENLMNDEKLKTY